MGIKKKPYNASTSGKLLWNFSATSFQSLAHCLANDAQVCEKKSGAIPSIQVEFTSGAPFQAKTDSSMCCSQWVVLAPSVASPSGSVFLLSKEASCQGSYKGGADGVPSVTSVSVMKSMWEKEVLILNRRDDQGLTAM